MKNCFLKYQTALHAKMRESGNETKCYLHAMVGESGNETK